MSAQVQPKNRLAVHFVLRILVLVGALAYVLIAGYPFVFAVLTALKSQMEFFKSVWSLPEALNLNNFMDVWNGGFARYFTNSAVAAFVSVFGVVALSSLASYAFARLRFKASRFLFILLLGGMMIPVHVTLIPIYVMTRGMGIYDTLPAVFGPYIGFSLPLTTIILTEFFAHVPRELEEAARIDGCSHFQTFYKIMLPLSTPALGTVSIYNFIFIWNEFIFALVLLSSPESMTLPLGLRQFYGEFSINIPGVMAAVTLATMPMVVFYLFAQERVVKGLVAGALKA